MKRWNSYIAFLIMALALTSCGNPDKEQYEQALQNLDQGHYEDALSGFQEAVSNDVSVAQAYRGQGIALLRLNRYEEAIEAFRAAIAQDEGGDNFQRDVWMYKASAEYKNGDAQQALTSAQAARTLGKDAQCSLLMGTLQLELDQYEDAAASFQAAIEADDSYAMYVKVYQAYMQKDMAADGEAYLQKALEKEAGSSEDHYQRGRIYNFMDDYENAVKELIEASNDGYGDAQLLLGKVYLDHGDSGNARIMYQQYMQTSDNPQAKGYNGLALCDIEEDDYDSALSNVQKGLEVAETDAVRDLMYNEVVIYEKMQDFDTAEEKLSAYLQLYPDDEEAQREQEFLLYR